MKIVTNSEAVGKVIDRSAAQQSALLPRSGCVRLYWEHGVNVWPVAVRAVALYCALQHMLRAARQTIPASGVITIAASNVALENPARKLVLVSVISSGVNLDLQSEPIRRLVRECTDNHITYFIAVGGNTRISLLLPTA